MSDFDQSFDNLSALVSLSPEDKASLEKKTRREIANSNERRRMQSINSGFMRLKSLVPSISKEKVSKVRQNNNSRPRHGNQANEAKRRNETLIFFFALLRVFSHKHLLPFLFVFEHIFPKNAFFITRLQSRLNAIKAFSLNAKLIGVKIL